MDLSEHYIATISPSAAANAMLQPPGLISLNGITGSLSQFTQVGGQNETISFPASNQIQFYNTVSSGDHGVVFSTSTPLGAPDVFVWTTVQAMTSTGGTPSYFDACVGIGDAANTVSLQAKWRKGTANAHFQLYANSSVHDTLAGISESWTPPFNLALGLVGNTASLWYQAVGASSWTFITKYDMSSLFDFRANGAFVANNMYPQLYADSNANSGSTTTIYQGITASPFGAVGIRDLAAVTTLQGTPILGGASGGVVTLMATREDPSASASSGLYTLDLAAVPPAFTQIGNIWTQRIVPSGTAPSVSKTLSGTFSATNGSASVTTTSSQVGIVFGGTQPSVIQFSGQTSVNYVVQSVTSSTITLKTSYTGSTASGQTALLGVWCNDNAGHISQDGIGGYNVLISSWEDTVSGTSGNQYLQVYYSNFAAIGGMMVMTNPTQLVLPVSSGGGCYDPYLVNSGGTYYLAYVNGANAANTFYPALASASSITGTWTAIFSDQTNATSYEGSRIAYLGGTYYPIWASLNSASNRVYDLTGNFRGAFLGLSGNTVHSPHPMLIPYNGFTYYVTYDSTLFNATSFTDGSVQVWRAPGYGVHP
jgi:hypothetical protein